MKQQETNTICDINSFDEQISIYKILFQDRAISLLKSIIEKIAIDRYENKNFRLPSILIVGKEGKQLLARAFSNSLCNSFEHLQGQHIGMGGCCGSLYENCDHETVYYVSSSDELTPYSVSYFYKFLKQGYTKFKSSITGELKTVSAENKLFIFSADDPKELCPDLYKAIDYHCYLQNTMQMEIIVEQRLKWCGVDYTEQIPAIIVHNSQGSISNCIRLLSVCYLIARGDCRNKITLQDVEKGIALNSQQERFVAPPPDDEMPF